MIRNIDAHTAEEFLDLLRLANPIWNLKIPGNTNWQSREIWGFRGQRDATWALIPSAFRETTTLGYKPNSGPPPLDVEDQKIVELKTLVDFLFVTDRVGLRVPGDGQHFRVPQLSGHPQRLSLDHWPWEIALETLAIAQHHGVPTRLLDFSHNPSVAAFFACYDAWAEMKKPSLSQQLDDSRQLAVWAVHLPLIFRSVSLAGKNGESPRVILVTAPRALNSFLHHQDGFFIVDLQADDYGYPPLEKAIIGLREAMVGEDREEFADPLIIKISLEWRHVPMVLAHFWNEFYHMARLQPTYDKVVQSLIDYRKLYS